MRSFFGSAVDSMIAACEADTCAYISKTLPTTFFKSGLGVESFSIIMDGDIYPVSLVLAKDRDPGRFRMLDTVLDAFLQDPEQDQLLLWLHFVGISFYYDLCNDNPCPVDPFCLLQQGFMDAAIPDPLTVQASGKIAQIGHRLADIIPDALQHFRVQAFAFIDNIDLDFGQAEQLPDIIMDLLADGVKGLLLDLQLGLERLFCELLLKIRQFLPLHQPPALVQVQK